MSDKEETRYGRDWPAISHLDYWQDKLIDETTYHILKDFKYFLYIVWKYLNLPAPTGIQYDVADYLQGNRSYIDLSDSDIAVEDLTGDDNGAGSIVCAYRSFGKSWITGAYCVWLLLRIPHLEITVFSASEKKCTAFISFVLNVLKVIPFCNHLLPGKDNVKNKFLIDTPFHRPSQSNSLAAIPLFSSDGTGRRSDVIIGDDLEVINNSSSMLQRDRVAERVAEFEAIMGDIPEDGKIKFKQKVLLGTPQTQETLYMRLVKKNGYEMRIWPSRYPNEEQYQRIGHLLCPKIKDKIDKKSVFTKGYGIRGDMGEPTDTRFTDRDLVKKERGYGYTGYQLQYQLDPSLSDLAKFPLKLSDLIVCDLNENIGHNAMIWSSDRNDIIDDLPNYGFAGDYYRRPSTKTNEMSKYESSFMCIDPSSGGAGKDETTYAIGKSLNGFIYLFDCGGFSEGPQSQATMDSLAALAKKYEVDSIIVESNQGLGMFEALLKPALIRAKYNCDIGQYRAVGQKEPRIIKTLEPVMNSHRLVVNRQLIENESLPNFEGLSDEARIQYSLFYQLTHLESSKDCLPKDDRIDVLHMLIAQFIEDVELDVEAELARKELDIVMALLEVPTILDNDTGYSTMEMALTGNIDDLRHLLDNNWDDLDMFDD